MVMQLFSIFSNLYFLYTLKNIYKITSYLYINTGMNKHDKIFIKESYKVTFSNNMKALNIDNTTIDEIYDEFVDTLLK